MRHNAFHPNRTVENAGSAGGLAQPAACALFPWLRTMRFTQRQIATISKPAKPMSFPLNRRGNRQPLVKGLVESAYGVPSVLPPASLAALFNVGTPCPAQGFPTSPFHPIPQSAPESP